MTYLSRRRFAPLGALATWVGTGQVVYDDAAMAWWADRIGEWRASGHTVFGYFNNDAGGNAFRNALTLKRFVGDRGH